MSNVRDFGATGDGQTDDTAAIEHAIRVGEGQIEFSPGTYRVTRSILIELSKTGRLAIQGTGGVPKLLMEGAGPLFDIRGTHEKTADPLGFRPTIWTHERMPTVSGLEIEGRHTEADGLRFSGVMQPTITNLLIRKVRHGIHITDRARNVLVSHCHIYHNLGCGIYLDRVNLHQTNIVGSHISYNRLGGIRIENSEIRNLQITGNDIEYNNNAAHKVPEADAVPTAEIFIDCSAGGTVREMTIASNTIQATRSENGCNIRCIGTEAPEQQSIGMCTISANVIGSQEVNVHLSHCRGVVLEGNYIYSGHRRNVVIEYSRNVVIGSHCLGHNPDYKDLELCTGIRLADCSFVNVTGLQMQDAQAGQNTVKESLPIERNGLFEIVRCRYVNLTGVQLLEGSPAGLYVEGSQHVQIIGCSIVHTRAVPLTQYSIHWLGESEGSRIVNCTTNRGISAHATVRREQLWEK
jgi:Pectate lyase superfamily protein